MIVISDTSCLFYLVRLQCVEILPAMFGEIIVPPKVAAELAAGSTRYPQIHAVINADWFQIRTLRDDLSPSTFPPDIDPGEAEAIKLALEMDADQLLMDDLAGRRLALKLQIPILGCLGVLLRARKLDLIGPLRPILAELVEHLGFRASPALVEAILKEAGE